MKRLFPGIATLVVAFAQPVSASCLVEFEAQRSSVGRYIDETNCRPSLNRGLISGFLIQGFDIRFTNGDHKPKAFGVYTPSGTTNRQYRAANIGPIDINFRNPRHAVAVLADPDGDDPIAGALRLLPYRFAEVGEISRSDCSGTCVLSLNRSAPDGTTLVLRGFLFTRHEGFDDNIRHVRIDPSCTAENCFYAVSYEDNDTRETYTVTLQYAFVPDRALRSYDSIGTPGRRFTNGPNEPQGGRTHDVRTGVLSGFDLRYTDGDRHLGRIAVMPDGRRGGDVVMRDGGDDGSMPDVRWSLLYADVTPSDLLMR